MPDPIITKNEAGEEIVTLQKADFDKIQSDRDNYKTMGLTAKQQLEAREAADKAAKDAQEQKDRDAAAAAGGKPAIDENKIGELATGAARKVARESSEKLARKTILARYPEYSDPALLTGMLSRLSFKGDESTTEEVLDRMEEAVLLHKRETGKLDEHMTRLTERARTEGRHEASIDMGRNAGGQGEAARGGGNKPLTPEGEQMARSFKNDPEKISKVDPKVDSVIEIKRK